MSNLRDAAQAAFNSKLALVDKLSKGGEWLGACRNWLQSNVKNGDRLTWGSGEVVHVPFHRFEELSLRVATAAVLEDRRERPLVTWNTDWKLIPVNTPVLVKLKDKKAPAMCMWETDEADAKIGDHDISMMLDQDWYGFIVDPEHIEGWLNPKEIK